MAHQQNDNRSLKKWTSPYHTRACPLFIFSLSMLKTGKILLVLNNRLFAVFNVTGWAKIIIALAYE